MSVSKAEFAWAGGDTPGAPTFEHDLPDEIHDALLQAIGKRFSRALDSDATLHALGAVDGVAGRYRLSTPENDWFVRVSSRMGFPGLERAIVEHLARGGVSVNPMIVCGAEMCRDDRCYRIDVRPFVEGRHFDGSTTDLRSAARALADCHRALATFPRSDEVRVIAADRNRRLSAIAERIGDALESGDGCVFAERADWARRNEDWLRQMVARLDTRMDLRPLAQCVHGELHRANVMYSDAGEAVLIDFEESPFLFAPVTWDIAFFFQRFCLWDKPLLDVARHRLNVVAESYGAPLPRLAPDMSQIAWYTLASIVEARLSAGVVTPVEEYDKFVMLQRQAESYEGVL
jgi:thiamine kinase-like enzyme